MNKKFLTVVLMIAMVFVFCFTGCGNRNDDPVTDSTPDNESLVEDAKDGVEDMGEDIKDGADDLKDDLEGKDNHSDMTDTDDNTHNE